jgi:hypothetical protein
MASPMCTILQYQHNSHNENVHKYIQSSTHIRGNAFNRPVVSVKLCVGGRELTTWSLRSRDTVIGITTGYGLDDRWVRVRLPAGKIICSSPHRPDRLWGSPNLLSNRYWGLLPRGVKRPGRESNHSPPESVEVMKTSLYTYPLPLTLLHGDCLIS